MPEDVNANELLKMMVMELRAVRRELAAIRSDVAPFVEDRRRSERMQSPLMSVDLFHAEIESERRD